jgi:predicted nuclease with RNAse H fold
MAEILVGIDFGAKRSGLTSVVSGAVGGTLSCHTIEKGRDTDLWLEELLMQLQPRLIAIDAPLSLPGTYTGISASEDYFYRKCDRDLGAMSPMFLGGLTARAMRLRAKLSAFEFIETYPSAIAKKVYPDLNREEKEHFEESIERMKLQTRAFHAIEIKKVRKHDLDALLCWHSAARYLSGLAMPIGLTKEGIIYL